MSNTRFAFNPTTDIPPLDGKVVLITGANTGLGKQTALELAKHNPAEIWMTARSVEKGQAAVAEVKQHNPGVKVLSLQLDLSSFDSIKKAAKEFLSSATRLDILFLNAGIFGSPPALTKDGYEIHMGTNHIGHALLLKLITPLLIKTATTPPATATDVRVVILTSIGYKMGKLEEGLNFHTFTQADALSPAEFYIQSKLANMLYAKGVASHFSEFTTVPLHPGEVATEFFSREPGDEQIRVLQTEVAPKHTYRVEEGVKNQLWAATDGGVKSGMYYEPVGVPDTAEGKANDKELASMLWDWTEEALRGHV